MNLLTHLEGSSARAPIGEDRAQLPSRRTLLAKAAVGAGVVWAAPTVLSSPASALGSSCQQPQTYTWANNRPPTGTGNLSGYNAGTSTTTGTPVSLALSFASGGSITQRGANLLTIGGTGNNFTIEKNGAGTGNTSLLTIVFSLPVLNLRFSILDVDRETSLIGNHYTDRVTINATTQAGAPVLPMGVTLGSVVSGAYPTFTGTGGANDSGTAGNVGLTYPSTGAGIKTLTISYISAQAQWCVGGGNCFNADTSTTQHIGVSGFQFC